MKKFSVIIVSYNTCKITLQCIESIYNTCQDEQFEIIVVDNASKDDSLIQIQKNYPKVIIAQNEANLGYAAAVNKGIKLANFDFFIVSNSDIIFLPNSIQLLINYLKENPSTAIVGPQQLFPNGKLQRSYNDFHGIKRSLKELFFINAIEPICDSIKKAMNCNFKAKEVEYLDGGVNAIRRTALEAINGYDENFFFYSEEADLCYRFKKEGWKVVFLPQSELIHLRGASSSKEPNKESKEGKTDGIIALADSKIRFCKKHHSKCYLPFYIALQTIYNFSFELYWKAFSIIFWKKDFSNRLFYFKNTKKIFYTRFKEKEWKKINTI